MLVIDIALGILLAVGILGFGALVCQILADDLRRDFIEPEPIEKRHGEFIDSLDWQGTGYKIGKFIASFRRHQSSTVVRACREPLQ